jgi:hypothetical protein
VIDGDELINDGHRLLDDGDGLINGDGLAKKTSNEHGLFQNKCARSTTQTITMLCAEEGNR